jgi:methylthioribose-1-phosphate isomerase
MLPETLRWIGGLDGHLDLIDQRLLPGQLVYIQCQTASEVWDAIKTLAVRGAPAIGVTAAYGAFIAAREYQDSLTGLIKGCEYLATSRPTAVNLFWALDRMKATGQKLAESHPSRDSFLTALLDEAKKIHEEDIAMCHAIGSYGADLVKTGSVCSRTATPAHSPPVITVPRSPSHTKPSNAAPNSASTPTKPVPSSRALV